MDDSPTLSRKRLILIAVIALLAILALAWSWSAAEDRRRKEEIVTAQGLARVLSATFSERNALKVGEVSGALDVRSVDPGRFNVFSSSQTVKLPYSVDYTVDLSQLSLEDYRWDADSRTLVVEIPDVVPGKPNIDESRRMLLGTEGLWVSRRASENLSRRAAVLATSAAAKEAQDPKHKVKARENAKRAVGSLLEGPLQVAGLGDVDVIVRFPGEGVRNSERWDVSPSIEEVLANRP